MSSLKDRVKALRLANKLSQADLAERIGLKYPSISAIELGRSAPTATIEAIANELNVDYGWLLNGEGETPAGVMMHLNKETNDKDKLIEQLKSQVAFYEEVIRNLSAKSFPPLLKKAHLRIERGGLRSEAA